MPHTGMSSSACRWSARSSYLRTWSRLPTWCCNLWGALLNFAWSIAKCCSSMSRAALEGAVACCTSKGSSAEKLPSTTTTGGRSGSSPASNTSVRNENCRCLEVGSMRTNRAVTGPEKSTRTGACRRPLQPSNSRPPSTGLQGPSPASAQETLNFVTHCGPSARGAMATPASRRGPPKSIWYQGEVSSLSAHHPCGESRVPR
mmetsp:Transcript_102095/g.284250  ORF Transcript_102095/g.284250 Transcript_102095/m.284250 type:complete len:202 (-) Transcript_102095:6-611(-)